MKISPVYRKRDSLGLP